MPKFAAIGLLVLLALTGLPLAIDGGAVMTCPSCPSAHSAMMFSICLAVLAVVVAFSLSMLGRIASSPDKHSAVLTASILYRPPRAT